MPGKNTARYRGYSVVLHDVSPDHKSIIQAHVEGFQPSWSLVAMEPYNHQEGFHCHIFFQYQNPRSFKQTLQHWLDFGKELDAGRVQVDIARGTYLQCKKYLENPDKDKLLDTEVAQILNHDRRTERSCHTTCPICQTKYFKYIEEWGEQNSPGPVHRLRCFQDNMWEPPFHGPNPQEKYVSLIVGNV